MHCFTFFTSQRFTPSLRYLYRYKELALTWRL
jgi:hypothetical protein